MCRCLDYACRMMLFMRIPYYPVTKTASFAVYVTRRLSVKSILEYKFA